MSKGLEALNRIRLVYECTDMPIIEKELKRLEELEKAFDALSKDDEKAKKLLSKEIEKNRALEIIKKLHIFDDINWEDYEKLDDNEKNIITQEEYDLLKEVLL